MKSRQSQQGFVLAVVLWSIAALTLITGGIIARINATLEQSYRMRELAQLDRDLMATEQTLLYLISTGYLNSAGLDLGPPPSDTAQNDPFGAAPERGNVPTLRFDGSLYQGVGAAGFALQDAGATFSLRGPTSDVWHGFMARLGVEPRLADRWLDELNDYQDRDDLARLNGAEADRYRELGLPEPLNGFISSPHELRNLPFARDYPGLTERLIRVSTAGAGTQGNVNTSPPEMLAMIYNLRGRESAKVAASRGGQLLTSLMQASANFGLVFQGGETNSVWQPTGFVRMMLGASGGRQIRWIAVNFTPNADGQPWLIEYSHPVNLHHRPQEPDTADAFSPSFQTEAALPADSWAHYSTFFPDQLPVD